MSAAEPVTGPDRLAPLAAALLDHARRDAAAALAAADADAADLLAHARGEADAILADARAKGADDAAAVLSAEVARAEREARGVRLSARSAAIERLRLAAREAVREAAAEAEYVRLVEALGRRAERLLGPHAEVVGQSGGGIVATVGTRRLEYSLDSLADDLVDGLGSRLEELWSP